MRKLVLRKAGRFPCLFDVPPDDHPKVHPCMGQTTGRPGNRL